MACLVLFFEAFFMPGLENLFSVWGKHTLRVTFTGVMCQQGARLEAKVDRAMGVIFTLCAPGMQPAVHVCIHAQSPSRHLRDIIIVQGNSTARQEHSRSVGRVMHGSQSPKGQLEKPKGSHWHLRPEVLPPPQFKCLGAPKWGERCKWTIPLLQCCCCFFRDIEYKELPLSLDQVTISKSQFPCRNSASTSQETRKATKPRSNKMKTKLRTTPYPQQVVVFPLYQHFMLKVCGNLSATVAVNSHWNFLQFKIS